MALPSRPQESTNRILGPTLSVGGFPVSKTLPGPLATLDGLRFRFGSGVAKRKLRLLDKLAHTDLEDADSVRRLHDLLRFIRAYPDNRAVLDRVETILETFPERDDFRHAREELINSGIAGTEVHFRFYWFTLCWLAERCGGRLRIDWTAFRGKSRALLDSRLTLLMPFNETLAIEEASLSTREWIEQLKGDRETDAEFVVGRFHALKADSLPREVLFEEIDIPFRLLPGPTTPSTTLECHRSAPVYFQTRPPHSGRDTFRREIAREPKVRSVPRREARTLIAMARTLMVVRERDLDAFVHADENDVRMFTYPEGIQFACMGTIPQRRQMLDAAYGFLILRNGITIGYLLAAGLFHSAEVAYNLSPEFRGAEAAHLYGRSIGVVRHLFKADAFVVDPYQMGHENPEGLRSGAWWFYYKLGFRPRDPVIARAAAAEARKVKETPGYRTGMTRLNRLASVNMYLDLKEPRDTVMGEFRRDTVGLRLSSAMAGRFGSKREEGLEACAREAAHLLGVSLDTLPPAERDAWTRWAPLVDLLGARSWSHGERESLAAVIRAKGGRRESDFVRRFDRHRRLREALWELSSS